MESSQNAAQSTAGASPPITPLEQVDECPSREDNTSETLAAAVQSDRTVISDPAPTSQDAAAEVFDSAASPPSTAPSKQNKRRRFRSEIPKFDAYWQRIRELTACLPHLKSLTSRPGRYSCSGSIVCLDVFPDSTCEIFSMFKVEDMPSRADLAIRVHELRATINPRARTRLVMVEDLCTDLIDALGSTFQIDPEFFAEHLNRSGYADYDHDDDDAEPSMWTTHHVVKPLRSITWLRPVHQSAKVSEWLREADTILAAPIVDDDQYFMSAPVQRPIPYYINPKETRRREAERLKAIVWKDHNARAHARDTWSFTSHHIVPCTNIFRKSWSLPGRPQLQLNKDVQAGEYAESIEVMRQRTVSTLWLEKATLFAFRDGPNSVPIEILLLDPLPGFIDHKRHVDPQNHSVQVEPVDVQMGLPVVPKVNPILPYNKYETPNPTVQAAQWSIDHCQSMQTALTTLISGSMLNQYEALLAIIVTDFRATRSTLNRALDQISRDSLDDYLMTRHASSWRQLMNELVLSMPGHAGSIKDLTVAIDPRNIYPRFQSLSATILAETNQIQIRLRDAYTSLRTDMQFTESRKSIAEAKSVTKLTELAFLFIPLSFSASLFSMSIQGLDEPVPIWTFVVTAAGFATLAYVARLLVASEFIADSSRKALEKFWIERNVRRGDSVPFVTLFFLTVKELLSEGSEDLSMAFEVLLILPFILIPIGFMWTTTTLGTGYSLALTLAILLSQLVAYLTLPESADFIAFSIKRSRWYRRMRYWIRQAPKQNEMDDTSL